MSSRSRHIAIFWITLLAFFTWDWLYAEPVNQRQEPAIFALGSGQVPSGGHCSAF